MPWHEQRIDVVSFADPNRRPQPRRPATPSPNHSLVRRRPAPRRLSPQSSPGKAVETHASVFAWPCTSCEATTHPRPNPPRTRPKISLNLDCLTRLIATRPSLHLPDVANPSHAVTLFSSDPGPLGPHGHPSAPRIFLANLPLLGDFVLDFRLPFREPPYHQTDAVAATFGFFPIALSLDPLTCPAGSLTMSRCLFLVESLGFPRNHHAIFVETSHGSGGGGYIFQVTGNIQEGMRYEMKATDASPDKDPSYHGQTRLGWVSANHIPRIDAICKSNPAPEKQFEGARKITAYPVRRCQEWTAETIGLLKERGVLVDGDGVAA